MPYTKLAYALKPYGITVHVHKRKLKNITFRLKTDGLHIAAPIQLPDSVIHAHALSRLDWIIKTRRKIHLPRQTTLWGNPCTFANLTTQLLVYRDELARYIPTLQAKWQPIVGKSATDVRIKKMHTRFGTCNANDARVWLSVYLPAYPKICTDYVFVHELCHLHYANHSPQFWACVQLAMPDYKQWHTYLQSQSLRAVAQI